MHYPIFRQTQINMKCRVGTVRNREKEKIREKHLEVALLSRKGFKEMGRQKIPLETLGPLDPLKRKLTAVPTSAQVADEDMAE